MGCVRCLANSSSRSKTRCYESMTRGWALDWFVSIFKKQYGVPEMDNSKCLTSSSFRVDCGTWGMWLRPVVLPAGAVFEIPFASGELR